MKRTILMAALLASLCMAFGTLAFFYKELYGLGRDGPDVIGERVDAAPPVGGIAVDPEPSALTSDAEATKSDTGTLKAHLCRSTTKVALTVVAEARRAP